MSIILSYPWWFLSFCVITGAVYAAGLYYRNRKQKEIPKTWVRILAVLRFTTVAILCFLLLSPLVRSIFRTVEKPVIVIARDNTSSIPLNNDSAFYRSVFPQQLNNLADRLAEKYEVVTYNFGTALAENTPYDFSEKQTDIANALDEIGIRYINRNLGAVILASDGLYNKGMNPLYHTASLKVPVYTIAMGDTTIRKDVIVSRVDYNKVVFLGNQFPFDITVDARKFKGNNVKLSVLSDGKTLFEKKLSLDRDDYTLSTSVILQADRPGTRKYRVVVSQLQGEVTWQNNYQDVYVEVIDSRQKVLILTDAPHPDIAALQQSINTNQNYQSEAFLVDDFNKNLRDYSLVIFYQLPSTRNASSTIISNAKNLNLPLVYVLGNSTNVNAFNQLNAGMKIIGNRNNADEVQPVYNPNFTYFTLEEHTRSMISRYPPVSSPYGSAFEISASGSPLLYRKIGTVTTQNPLMVFVNDDRQKSCIIAGEGLFRWRLYEYSMSKNTSGFDELVNKTVQYLAVKEDKSLFRVNASSQFFENEPVIMDAELYNESYELINEPDVKIDIKNSEDKTYPFTFSKTTHAYKLNAGILPVGEYEYSASVNHNGKAYRKSGMFTVKAIQVEAVNTVADHQLMYMLAANTGGEMVYPRQLDQLYDLITQKEEIVSKSYSQKQLRDLIHYKWIFFLLLVLLSIEWFMRKRQGVY